MLRESFNYFWMERSLLPEPMGFGLFSAKHIAALILTFSSVFLLYRTFGKLDEKKQTLFLWITALCLPVIELFKIGLLIHEDVFYSGYFPLYLCSLGIYIFPLIMIFKRNPVGEWLSLVSLLIIFPGSIGALLFPNWIGIYPAFSFFSIYSFFWHGILLLFPLCIFRRGVKLDKTSVPKAMLFPVIMLPLIRAADIRFNENYWFIEYPEDNNPFYGVYNALGYTFYLGCFIILAFIMAGVFWIIFRLLQKRAGEKNGS